MSVHFYRAHQGKMELLASLVLLETLYVVLL